MPSRPPLGSQIFVMPDNSHRVKSQAVHHTIQVTPMVGPHKEKTLKNVNFCSFSFSLISLLSITVKNLPAVQETRVRSLGREDPLEKEIITHSRILAWRIP